MDTDSQKKQAMITSLRLLTATSKSRTELSTRLRDKGYAEEIIQETLTELEKQGVLNDRSFAENLKSRLTVSKPSGARKIEFEMKRHGVPAKIRQEIMEELNPEEEKERARELGSARWKRFSSLPGDKRKKRIFDFLVRRGFSFQIAKDLIEELEGK
ncbi:MAG: hypothetical protein EXS63_01665 [Candidatus Omnitrophica bacterium]|nr:hypothetical protein [Candidatus Omnitrophota bacterium]